MVSKYTEQEQKAMIQKLDHPNETVMCPRCGTELHYKEYGNSCEVKCETSDCLHGGVRGI